MSEAPKIPQQQFAAATPTTTPADITSASRKILIIVLE